MEFFFFQAEDGIRDRSPSRGLGDVYKRQKKQRGLLDREKISLSDIEQSYGSWRSHAEKGNCYHLIQKTDSLFQNLFKESEKQWPKV